MRGRVSKDVLDAGFRSRFELQCAPTMAALGGLYESVRLPFSLPDSVYLVDWVLPNGICLETKGYFTPADRRKLQAVKRAHPTLDLRLVFQNARNKLHAKSPTTYGEWATKHGFPWTDVKRDGFELVRMWAAENPKL